MNEPPRWLSGRAIALTVRDRDSNDSRDRPKSLTQIVTVPVPIIWNRCECYGSSEMTIINA